MGFAIFILLFVAALIAVPFLFKDKVNDIVKEEINNQLNAKVDYGALSFTRATREARQKPLFLRPLGKHY